MRYFVEGLLRRKAYCLARNARLMPIVRERVLFDNGLKKIAKSKAKVSDGLASGLRSSRIGH
jgi:hypothetical protein